MLRVFSWEAVKRSGLIYVVFYVFRKLGSLARMGLGGMGACRRVRCGVLCAAQACRVIAAHRRSIAAGIGSAVCFCTAFH